MSQIDQVEVKGQPYTLAFIASLVVAGLMAVASIAGLAGNIYPTEALRQSFVANDVVNLLIGLPILIISMFAARRGQLLGLLFWPGALFFVFYTYIAYIIAVPFSLIYLCYLALVSLSGYTMAGLVAGMDSRAIEARLHGVVPDRLAGGALAVLGVFVLMFAVGSSMEALTNGTPLPISDLAVMVADAMILPAWIIGGVLLWRHKALGYVIGAGLLFQASMLFIALLAFMLLQPILSTASFKPDEFITILVMGMVSFVPFGLFLCGVMSRRLPKTR